MVKGQCIVKTAIAYPSGILNCSVLSTEIYTFTMIRAFTFLTLYLDTKRIDSPVTDWAVIYHNKKYAGGLYK